MSVPRIRAALLTLLAASVAWFVLSGVPRFSSTNGTVRFERDHETVSTVVAAVRVIESAKELTREVVTVMPCVAPARSERLPVATFVAPPPARASRAFSMVFLI